MPVALLVLTLAGCRGDGGASKDGAVDGGAGDGGAADGGASDGGAGDGGAGDGGAGDGGAGDGGAGDGGASDGPPVFYFVLHADPATPDDLSIRWDRLVGFMQDLDERNAGLDSPHHVTIMFTPAWGELLMSSASARKRVAGWAAEGHQLAFHSHTHNHAYRDGYSNATGLVDDVDEDGTDRCFGDRDAGECTLDHGLARLEEALTLALGSAWTPRFGAVGPHDNGGPGEPNGRHDNSCDPALDADGQPLADTSGCIDLEWVGMVATIPFSSSEYDHLTATMDPDSPEALLGTSYCKDLGERSDVYLLPHAPFQTEAGSAAVSKASILAALAEGDGRHRVGVVIHPISYAHRSSSGYDGDAAALIQSLFTEVEEAGFRSVTLDEARDIDLERGGGCP